MIDQITICPRCTSDACFVQEVSSKKYWNCFGCGFYTESDYIKGNKVLEELILPELYKDLEYKDEDGYYWYPKTVNIPNKGMVFVDGRSIMDWKWAAVIAIPLAKKEKPKFKGQTHKMDMKTIKHFDEKDFMEALDYIGFFEKN